MPRDERKVAGMPQVDDATLALLGRLPTTALVDALSAQGYPQTVIVGARALFPGRPMAGRAVTLRFVPHRPDLADDKPAGAASPEYEAFELCGPSEVLVASSLGPGESIGGDIKFFRLMQRAVGGLVTDGSVRDPALLLEYGFPVYAAGVTSRRGPGVMIPWGVNEVIGCGGVTVRPGDAVVGDDDGAVVVPAAVAAETAAIAEEREAIEGVIKRELERNPGSPGAYYPFNEATEELYRRYRERGEA
jgi:regulator of RNase E activity RraA